MKLNLGPIQSVASRGVCVSVVVEVEQVGIGRRAKLYLSMSRQTSALSPESTVKCP